MRIFVGFIHLNWGELSHFTKWDAPQVQIMVFHMGDGVLGHPFNTAILRYLGNMRMVHHLMAVRDSVVE